MLVSLTYRSPLEAYEELMSYANRRGEVALKLAMHAAVPQAFRSDLLHLLKLNFVPEAAHDYAVEADVLFSPLCEHLGQGYFQFDPFIRLLLLDNLATHYQKELETRIQRVANFLIYYIDNIKYKTSGQRDRMWRDYLEVQRWVALAFLDPDSAALQLANAIKQKGEAKSFAARLQLGRLANSLSAPLIRYQPLLNYAAAIQALEMGQLEEATELFGNFKDEPLQVGDVVLRPPSSLITELSGPSDDVFAYKSLYQLPKLPPHFIGRADELDEVKNRIEKENINTFIIEGAGGSGKTYFALELSRQLSNNYPDAQFYLNLKGSSPRPLSATEAQAHVIRSYDPTVNLPEDRSDLRAQYIRVLEGKHALLLMDNAASAEQVEPLIPPSDCLLLITAREHFTLNGAHTIQIGRMPRADAAQLILTIAPQVGAAADTFAELCGYLPLALRLVGGVLNHSGLETTQFIDRLINMKKNLAPDLGAIKTALYVSYELLDSQLRRLWRILGICQDVFDIKAAADLWGLGEDETQAALDKMVEISLVEFDKNNAHYRLHDIMRLFADTRLSRVERDANQLRYARHFLDVLRETEALYLKAGQAQREGLYQFDLWRANIEACQSWAQKHLEDNLDVAKLCSDYPSAGSNLLNLRLSPRARVSWLETAITAAHKLQDQAAEARHLGLLGIAYADLSDTRRAIYCYEQQLKISRDIRERYNEGYALRNLGVIHMLSGDTERAIKLFNESREIAIELNDKRSEGRVLGNLSSAYQILKKTDLAIEFNEKRLAIAREVGDRRSECAALFDLGNKALNEGNIIQAIDYYEKQFELAREIGDAFSQGDALGGIGRVHATAQDFQKALEFYQRWLNITRNNEDKIGEAYAQSNIGLAFEKLKDIDQAISHSMAALKIFERARIPLADEVRNRIKLWENLSAQKN